MKAKSYTEVLAILDSINSEDVKKIPEYFISYLRRNADSDYTCDVKFDNQLSNLNERDKSVLEVIVTIFGALDMKQQ